MKKALSSKILLLVLLCLAISGCSKESKETKVIAKANKLFEENRLEEARIEYLNAQRFNPTNKIVVRRLAEIYYSQADLRRAFAYLVKSKELGPDDLEVRRMLARTFLAAGRRKEAATEAREILAIKNDYFDAILLLAETVPTVPDLEKTRSELESIKSKIGEKPAVQVALANILVMEGKANLAEPILQKVLTADPKFGPAYLAQAGIYVGRNDTNNAIRAFEQAVQNSVYEKLPIQMIWATYQYRMRNFDEAKALVEKALAINPYFLPAHSLSAKIAFREGDAKKASSLTKTILDRDPSHYEAQILNAEMEIAKDDFPKAFEILEVLLKEYPDNTELLIQCAKAYRADNQLNRAVSLLNQAITLNPESPEAILMLADINLKRGDLPPVISSLTALLKKQPRTIHAYLLLGRAYEKRQSTAEALKVYTALSQVYPQESVGYYLAGVLHRNGNNLQKARESFQQALQAKPEDLSTIRHLVDIDLIEGKNQSALTRAEDAVAKYPKSAVPHLFRAKVYITTKNPKEAEEALVKAIEVQPDEVQAYLELANFYRKAQKQNEAIAIFTKLASKYPNRVGPWVQIGVLQHELEKYPEAVDAYEKALTINPKFAPALNNLAYIYSEQMNSPDKAYDLAKKARDLLPEDPSIADTFGWILYRRGDYPRALQLFNQGADGLEKNPEAYYHLGLAQYALNQEEDAKKSFSKVLEFMTSTKYKAEAQSKLDFLNAKIPEGEAGIKQLELHLKQNSKDVVAWSRHAEALEKVGKLDAAVRSLETAIEISPSAMTPLMNLARITIDKLADEEKGAALLKRIRAISPDDPYATYLSGKVAYRKNDFTHAYDFFNISVRSLPNKPELLYDLALSEFALGYVSQAKDTLGRFIAQKPEESRPVDGRDLLMLISLFQNMGAPEQARLVAQKTLAKDEGNLPALMVMAKSYELENNKTLAFQTYEKVLQKNPSYPPAMKRLAILNAETDDKKAIEWAEKARTVMRGDVELARVIGLSSYRLGDYKRAVPYLLESIAQKSDNAQVLFCLGLAQYQLKRTSEARNYLNQALAMDGKSDMANQARKILAQLK